MTKRHSTVEITTTDMADIRIALGDSIKRYEEWKSINLRINGEAATRDMGFDEAISNLKRIGRNLRHLDDGDAIVINDNPVEAHEPDNDRKPVGLDSDDIFLEYAKDRDALYAGERAKEIGRFEYDETVAPDRFVE
jgi:hypothetical protein